MDGPDQQQVDPLPLTMISPDALAASLLACRTVAFIACAMSTPFSPVPRLMGHCVLDGSMHVKMHANSQAYITDCEQM